MLFYAPHVRFLIHRPYCILRLPSIHPGGRTAADNPSNPVALHIPELTPPVAGHYNSPVYVDPVVGPSLFPYFHQLPVAALYGVEANRFAP
jgi:hypothetical protein